MTHPPRGFTLRGFALGSAAVTLAQNLLCSCAALCVGLSKSGFPGVSLMTVALMAQSFPALQSTGVLLPLLIVGDVCAVRAFQRHTVWPQVFRMLPPTMLGVVAGFLWMRTLPESGFKPVLGWMLLLTVGLQGVRAAFPELASSVPHSRIFAWSMGLLAGFATMMANAAGPVMAIYFLALSLPKENLVGTSAWFFLIINTAKLPFSAALGLLHTPALLLDLQLAPLVLLGTWLGERLLGKVPQRVFETLLLASAAAAAMRLVW